MTGSISPRRRASVLVVLTVASWGLVAMATEVVVHAVR